MFGRSWSRWAGALSFQPCRTVHLWRHGALVALPEGLLFLDSALLPGVGLVGEAREAEQRRLPAAEQAPVAVLFVGGLPVLGDIEPDVDVTRGQDERPGDAVAPGDDRAHGVGR